MRSSAEPRCGCGKHPSTGRFIAATRAAFKTSIAPTAGLRPVATSPALNSARAEELARRAHKSYSTIRSHLQSPNLLPY